MSASVIQVSLPCNINEFHYGWYNFHWLVDDTKSLQPRIWDGYQPWIRFNGTKRVILRSSLLIANQSVEQRALT